jgi:hypothetical protein
MDEDQILSSIIADPDLVDPSIDISKLRQTTETNPRLLAEVPEFSGLKFDPSKGSYIEDLYSIYGGGLPTIDVAQDPTTMIPQTPVIDTPIGAGGGDGGGGGNGGDSIITPDTTIRDELIDKGIQAAEDDKGDMMLDEGVPVGEAYPPEDMLSFDDQYQEIEDIPIKKLDEGVLVGDAYPPIDTVDYSELDDLEADIGAQAIKDFEPEQQNLIDLAFSKVGSTANDVMNDLSQIPGAVVDFVNQTVDIAGKKINVGATLLKAGINKIVGGPITLVFDALSAAGLEGGPTLQTQKAQSIGLAGEGEYQDKYGINTQSMLGDYDQYNVDRVEELQNNMEKSKANFIDKHGSLDAINEYGKNWEEMNKRNLQELKDRQEYNKISGVGGDVEGDQEGITIAEDIALQDRIDAGIDAAEDDKEDVDIGPVGVDAGTADIQEFADIYEPPQDTGGDDRPSPNEAAGKAAEDAQRAAIQDAARAGMTVNQAKASVGMPANLGDTGGGDGGGGGGKIVCTMMNESYGFGSFRNKIWLRHSKDLAPEYQIGYHKIFLPLVRLSKTNKLLKKTLEHIAVHRTIDIRQEARGKKHLLGRVYRKVLEPICYIVGKYAKR